MGVLITSANFVGKFALPDSIFDDLDDLIATTEEDYLNDLMGADLYAAFKATVTGTPPKPVGAGYLNIYNLFNIDYGSKVYRSKGLVAMLCGFIYFDFITNVKYKATREGLVVNTPDTSREQTIGNLYAYLNEATDTFNSIQMYIQNIHPELFTVNFNGQEKAFGISIFQ